MSLGLTSNLGGIERIVRFSIAGLTLGPNLADLAGLAVPTQIKFLVNKWLYPVGIIALVTGAISFCPVWHLAGISTVPKSEQKKA